MEKLHTNYELGLEILTPVHVGDSAEKIWKKDLDFFSDNGKTYILNSNKVFESLGVNEINKYVSFLSSGNLGNFANYIKSKIDLEKNAICPPFNFNNGSAREIRPIIRGGLGKTYIPGSSIKGALRTIIFADLYKSANPEPLINNEVDNAILGNFENSIMKFISVSDVEVSKTDISTIKLFNLYKKGNDWESRLKQTFNPKTKKDEEFNIFAETFRPSTSKYKLRLTIADGVLAFIEAKKEDELKKPERERKTINLPKNHEYIKNKNFCDDLFKLINDHTLKFIKKELAFFNKYDQLPETNKIIENLENIKSQIQDIKDNKSCIFRMSFGSGFYGISGDWRIQIQDHLTTINKPDELNYFYSQTEKKKVPARYKSRKIINNNLMGFVKLHQNITDFEEIKTIKIKEEIIIEVEKPKSILEQALETKPEYLPPNAKIKQGTEIYAKVIKSDKPNKVKLFIAEGNEPEMYLTYNGLKEGTILVVKVNQINGKGQILQVGFSKFKT